MLEKILSGVVAALVEVFPAEEVKKAIDKGLDKIEDAVEKTENKIDDIIVLTAIKKLIREPFGIEDNDDQQADAEQAEGSEAGSNSESNG